MWSEKLTECYNNQSNLRDLTLLGGAVNLSNQLWQYQYIELSINPYMHCINMWQSAH